MLNIRRLLRRALFSGAALTGTLALANKSIEEHAADKNILDPDDGLFYDWTHARVFYRKAGSGETPLLLIHTASVFSSGHEFSSVIKALAGKYTVYCLDLPGCGLSEKPALTYTNYFFSSLICAFIRDVIGERAVVAASGLSGSFAIMAQASCPELFSKIYLINPPSDAQTSRISVRRSGIIMAMMSVPVIGRAVYYAITSRPNISRVLEKKYFKDPGRIRTRTADACYEASHLGEGRGRYFLASLNGRYMNWDMKRALTNLTVPVVILYSSRVNNAHTAAKSLRRYSSKISLKPIGQCGLLPQLEQPEAFISELLSE